MIKILKIIYDYENPDKNSRKLYLTKFEKSDIEIEEKNLNDYAKHLKEKSNAVQVSFAYKNLVPNTIEKLTKNGKEYVGFKLMKDKLMYWRETDKGDKCYVI